MSEVSVISKVYTVNYQCDHCKLANIVLTTIQTKAGTYGYVCPNCKETITLTLVYPYLKYV